VRVFNLMTQLHQFEIITFGLKILMGFIGTLTLGIGGVGLMNIMLVSVTQRTREIGVQKALGAKRRYILMQFLAEALTITFIGGIFGVILAYAVATSVGRLTLYSAFAKNGKAGDIRLMIAPGTLIASTLILGAGSNQRYDTGFPRLAIGSHRGLTARITARVSRLHPSCTGEWPSGIHGL
jgi:putative ABC transport system permease protein